MQLCEPDELQLLASPTGAASVTSFLTSLSPCLLHPFSHFIFQLCEPDELRLLAAATGGASVTSPAPALAAGHAAASSDAAARSRDAGAGGSGGRGGFCSIDSTGGGRDDDDFDAAAGAAVLAPFVAVAPGGYTEWQLGPGRRQLQALIYFCLFPLFFFPLCLCRAATQSGSWALPGASSGPVSLLSFFSF